ncbi:MAG TPA: hypothetical protein VIV58_00490 [Kofleriaceae bacterium]
MVRRRDFDRQMRQRGWKRIGVIEAGPATFVKWVKGERVIFAPNHDLMTPHTAHKLLGEAEG